MFGRASAGSLDVKRHIIAMIVPTISRDDKFDLIEVILPNSSNIVKGCSRLPFSLSSVFDLEAEK